MARRSKSTTMVQAPPAPAVVSFAFGDPEPVLNNDINNFLGVYGVFVDVMWNFWIPPVSLLGLARTLDANPHHNSILRFQRNMLAKWFRPSPILSLAEFRKAALDFRVFGMAYFRIVRNRLGGILRLERRPALMMRRGIKPGVFFEMQDWRWVGNPIEYQPYEIIQIMEDDVKQGIYGIPEWFGGLQSVLLSEDITLFRRKFFKNGAHVGYILVTSDANISSETAKVIEAKIENATGPGNFRNMYLNIPRSTSREPVKVIPIGDIATKDDYQQVKNITKSEILAMHRMQPGIAGIIPESMTGFGDLEKVMRVYVELEVPPMQQPFLSLNDYLPAGGKIVFDEPVWAAA